jgi:transketolase
VTGLTGSSIALRPRRGVHLKAQKAKLANLAFWEDLDLVYRTLVATLFNFVPTSGHPGGSISSGRIAQTLAFDVMDYAFSDPASTANDLLCYAAGHKALGLYCLWGLRNECVRIHAPALLPEVSRQLRLEDLMGFRRNPTQPTPLFKKFKSKALDGHPTPITPFIPIATGASGVGAAAAMGVALAALDLYGAEDAPRVHAIEGEGGMTAGRVHEALASAATMGLSNFTLHVDWNQASIDSDRVCADGDKPGDYVQWTPAELLALHDWNVVEVEDGKDFALVHAAQKLAAGIGNDQPTAIVYRTVKGWQYGIEGRKSHGAGHKCCSPEFYKAIGHFEERFKVEFPRFEGEQTAERLEASFWQHLEIVREALEADGAMAKAAADRVEKAGQRLKAASRNPRHGAPELKALYEAPLSVSHPPAEVAYKPGQSVTIRQALGASLSHLNKLTKGALLGAAADLLESTSISVINEGFPKGFFHSKTNPGSRIASVGGICEDAMGAVMAGVSSYRRHIGVTSSYAAFIAALEHVAARLHVIGQQARRSVDGEPYQTFIMINAHAGPKTGEDGPTHADPQALQLLQNNFPEGTAITLVPWEPAEVWPLLIAGLQARPALLAPFVTRPPETIVDRAALRLPPAEAAAKGVYAMRRCETDRTVVLAGSGAGVAFVRDVLPQLDKEGLEVNVFYVASSELFDLLPQKERETIFPERLALQAMGITDFTLPTLWRWIRSDEGLRRSLHSFRTGHYLGSGQGDRVLAEAGIDGPSQLRAIREWSRAKLPSSAGQR